MIGQQEQHVGEDVVFPERFWFQRGANDGIGRGNAVYTIGNFNEMRVWIALQKGTHSQKSTAQEENNTLWMRCATYWTRVYFTHHTLVT